MRPALFLLCLACALTGCAQFPALDGAPTRAPAGTPWPALLPIDPLLAEAAAPGRAASAAAALEGRAAGLRARAAAMRAAP